MHGGGKLQLELVAYMYLAFLDSTGHLSSQSPGFQLDGCLLEAHSTCPGSQIVRLSTLRRQGHAR
jgi:hypothetical protein